MTGPKSTTTGREPARLRAACAEADRDDAERPARLVQLRRRDRPQVRHRHDRVGRSSACWSACGARSSSRCPSLNFGAVLHVRPAAPAAHQRGDLRLRRQRDLRRRLLLDAAPAARRACAATALERSTSGAGRRSSSPPRSRCRSASRRRKEYAELEWPIDIAIAVVWVVFAVNFFGDARASAARSTSTSRSGSTSRRSSRSRSCTSSTTSSIPVGAVQELLDLRRRAGRAHAVVVRPQRRRVLPDHAVPRHHVLLPAEGGGAAGLLATGCRSSTSGRWSSSTSGPARTTCTTRRCREWASTLGMIFSVMLWMPSWGGMINGLLTLRGAWNKVAEDPVLKFFVVGITFYGMATFEGPLLSIKSVNALVALHRLDHRPRPRRRARLERLHGVRHDLLARAAPVPDASCTRKKLATPHFWVATSASCSTSSRCRPRHHAGPDVARVRRDRPARSTPTSSRP